MTVHRRTVLSLPIVVAAGAGAASLAGSLAGSSSASAAVPQQSPVNIVRHAVQHRADLPQLSLSYVRSTPVSVRYVSKDDSTSGGCSTRGAQETEEVDIEPGAGHVDLAGVRYDLKQFHFHTPSEHTLDGHHFPLEMHLVHQSAAGRRLVIGVLLHAGRSGEPDRILRQLADECGTSVEVPDLDLRALLPDDLATVRYLGSLTTAPYTEDVQWFLTRPQTVSRRGIANFEALFPDGDSRASQPLNGRTLLADPRW